MSIRRFLQATALILCIALIGCATSRKPIAVRAQDSITSSETLAQALENAKQRNLTNDPGQPIEIVLPPGVYSLTEPLVLGPECSGTKQAPFTIRAKKKGSVIVTGGTTVTGWQPWRDGIWCAKVAEELSVNTLYWKSRRQILARFPNRDPQHPRTGGMLYATAKDRENPKTTLHYDPKFLDPTTWKEAPNPRVVVWPKANWNCDYRNILGFDLKSHTLRIKPARYELIRGNRFYLENALAMLDAPGEWFFDNATHTLYFKPPNGKDPKESVTIPLAENLIRLQGNDADSAPVRHILIEGIRFRECAKTAITLSHASDCVVRTCEIADVGTTGITLEKVCQNNRIAGCDITRTGTEGILILGERDWNHCLENRTSGNVITNNHVHHIGMSGNAGGAIDLRPYCGGNVTHDNVISHNDTHDTPRKGIMFGGIRNIVEYNHVHHTNLEQSDTGGIGMCTRDLDERGSIIRYNYIHQAGGYCMTKPGTWEYPYFCWDVYLDDITSGVTVFGNILEGGYLGGLHIHGGQDNVIENNIFLNGIRSQATLSGFGNRVKNGRAWKMKGNRIKRNIFVYSKLGTRWLVGNSDLLEGLAESNENLIWPGDAEVDVRCHHKEPIKLEDWRKLGFDTKSLVADPKFINQEKGDYRLAPDSPALALGFKQIPIDKIGLQNNQERFSWPGKQKIWRETPVGVNQLPPKQIVREKLVIPRLTVKPVIDGALAEFERKGKVELILAQNHRGDKAAPTSRARVRWDDEGIYFGIYSAGNEGKAIIPGTTWGKVDAIELAIRADDAPAKTPILVLRGFTDGTLVVAEEGGMSAEACAEAKAAIPYKTYVMTERKWAAEIKLPWSQIPGLGQRPKTTPLQFNLTCRKPKENVWLMWKATGRHSYGVGKEGVLLPTNKQPEER